MVKITPRKRRPNQDVPPLPFVKKNISRLPTTMTRPMSCITTATTRLFIDATFGRRDMPASRAYIQVSQLPAKVWARVSEAISKRGGPPVSAVAVLAPLHWGNQGEGRVMTTMSGNPRLLPSVQPYSIHTPRPSSTRRCASNRTELLGSMAVANLLESPRALDSEIQHPDLTIRPPNRSTAQVPARTRLGRPQTAGRPTPPTSSV